MIKLNKRFSKFKEEYYPSNDLGDFERYNPEIFYNLKV